MAKTEETYLILVPLVQNDGKFCGVLLVEETRETGFLDLYCFLLLPMEKVVCEVKFLKWGFFFPFRI